MSNRDGAFPRARVLVLIPARGGSKGIPRKNVRTLAGRPLLWYSVRTALNSKFAPDVVVSSDDPEVLALAAKYGVTALQRDASLADDSTTLDEVVLDAWETLVHEQGRDYDVVVTLQPTSPLLRTESLDLALDQLLADDQLDTLISARDDTHLTWRREGNRYAPNYSARLNRQYLPAMFRETGAFLLSRRQNLVAGSRIGSAVSLYELSDGEAIDIDSLEDFNLAEWHLTRRHVVFVVAGYPEIGLGHVYNALTIANDLTKHDLTFLVDERSDLAADALAARNFRVVRQQSGEPLLTAVLALGPQVVINDRLDTDAEYVCGLKAHGIRVVNFEDLGEGAAQADLVINAIYPERQILANHFYGHRYFCVRNEFLATPPIEIRSRVQRVLVSFGGTDPGNLTKRVLQSVAPLCRSHEIDVDVILGMGYVHEIDPAIAGSARIHRDVANISDYMARADVVFTSAGRTVFEIACLGVPAIVIAQNAREGTHFFASEEHGFNNLGLAADVRDEEITDAFKALLDSVEVRRHMSKLMLDNDLREGKQRVMKLIERSIETL